MEINNQNNFFNSDIDFSDLSEDEQMLLNHFRALTDDKKSKFLEYVFSQDIDESEIKKTPRL